MSHPSKLTQYDEVLTSILVNEKSILGFLSAVFNFLARRTDFYYVPKGPYENMGFPAGVAEELVVKVLRKCDPKIWHDSEHSDTIDLTMNNEIMCSTVAHEVEVGAEHSHEDHTHTESGEHQDSAKEHAHHAHDTHAHHAHDGHAAAKHTDNRSKVIPDGYKPPEIPIQKNSETYNGAQRDNYSWSQNITELDVIVRLPRDINSARELRVTINSGDVCVARRNGDSILKDTLPYRIRPADSFWSISEGKLLMHLEKVQERWWDRFLSNEEPVDLTKIDCSRPLDELPEDHVAKVRELQWNQERKMKGLPTSDEMRNMDILKKAWNAPGSPFQGQEFDPSIINSSPNTFSTQK